MKTNSKLRTISGCMKIAIVLLVLLSQLSWAVGSASAVSGTISGVINGPDGTPLLGVSVLVQAIRKADGTGAANTYTDPADGTYSMFALVLEEDLVVVASNEEPDVDGYPGRYYDNVNNPEWAVTIRLTSSNPTRADVDITLGDASTTAEHLTFNTRADRLLNDVNIRRAIAWGIDRQYILENVFGPAGYGGEVLSNMVLPGMWFEAVEGDPDLMVYSYSTAMANSILDEAGWDKYNASGYREKNDQELVLDFATTTAAVRTTSAAIFQAQMAAIGININVILYSPTVFFSDDPAVSPLIQGNFDIAEFAWVLTNHDSLLGVFNSTDSQNYGGYSNIALDNYFGAALDSKVAGDNTKFLDSALDWQYEFSSDLPALPMFTRVVSQISGVIYGPDSNPLTGVSVQVRAVYISDGTEAAITYTDPADGTYTLTGLPLEQDLAVVASDEDPDTDGFTARYYDHVPYLEWAVGVLLTLDNPSMGGVDITLSTASLTVEHLTFNTRAGRILTDVTIRKAIAYGTDREYLLDNAWEPFGTTGEILDVLMYPGVWFEAPVGDPSLTVYDYNPAASVALLEGIGWIDTDADGYREKGGQELALDFITVNIPTRAINADLFAAQMEAIGIRVNVILYNAVDFFSNDPTVSPLIQGIFDIAEFAWIMDDTDYLIGVFETGNTQNYGGYSNGTLDWYLGLARDAKVAGDNPNFLNYALEWQYEYTADLPALPLFTRVSLPVISGTLVDSLWGAGLEVLVRAVDESGAEVSSTFSTLPDGFYSLLVPEGFSGSVVPELSGYIFNPVNRLYSNVTSAITDQDYIGTLYYQLTVSKAGTGSGWVGSNPSGISCGTDCTENYALSTVVKLTATPGAGSAFTGWTGACGGVSNTCYVTMSKAKNVTATFTTNPVGKYYLSTVKVGSGTILSSPAGISCPTDCSEFFNSGTSVKLVATASAGYVFTGWSGACGGTGSTCFVPMTKNKSVTATFLAVPSGKYYLGVKKAGSGSVESYNYPGISCGTDCAEFYNSGLVIRLKATPAAGYSVTWSGACGGTSLNCYVTMSTHKFVKATFTLTAFLEDMLRTLARNPHLLWRGN